MVQEIKAGIIMRGTCSEREVSLTLEMEKLACHRVPTAGDIAVPHTFPIVPCQWKADASAGISSSVLFHPAAAVAIPQADLTERIIDCAPEAHAGDRGPL
jgi:hypothetical protein